MTNVLQYHSDELRGALNAPEDGRNRPQLRDDERFILDVGCGIGQSFDAWLTNGLGAGRYFTGVDIDAEAIRIARATHPECSPALTFFCGPAEKLPAMAGQFDLVFSRVTLPYTNVPVALREMTRVLRPGGRIWLTMHPRDRPGMMLRDMHGLRKKAYRCVEWFNGYCLALFGVVIPVGGRYISWQHPNTIALLLARLGVSGVIQRFADGHIIIQGEKQ